MTTVLMVDDDENCTELWTRMLDGLRAQFIFARTIEEALVRMAEIPPPDLVLLDLKVPPFTADETLLAINAFRQFNSNLGVIAISGMKLEEIMRAIETAGVIVQGAISKDDAISQSRLLGVVQSCLARSGNYRETMDVLERASGAIEKKRTDRIELPPDNR